MFNPAEYSIKNSAAYAKKNELGKDYADYQFVHGESRELSVSLYFDTTDSGKHLDNIKDNEKNRSQSPNIQKRSPHCAESKERFTVLPQLDFAGEVSVLKACSPRWENSLPCSP